MSNSTKITGLTGLQIQALHQARTENLFPITDTDGQVVINKTTAVFPWDAETTARKVQEAKAGLVAAHGSRRHPVASFHAVVRKTTRAALDASL